MALLLKLGRFFGAKHGGNGCFNHFWRNCSFLQNFKFLQCHSVCVCFSSSVFLLPVGPNSPHQPVHAPSHSHSCWGLCPVGVFQATQSPLVCFLYVGLAIGKAMLKKRRREEIINSAYNRHVTSCLDNFSFFRFSISVRVCVDALRAGWRVRALCAKESGALTQGVAP